MLRKRKLSNSPPKNQKKPRESEDEEVTLKPQVRRSPNGYILPPPLPPGFQIGDNQKNHWILSSSIGIGGFGEIYSAASSAAPKKKDFVIKVEPHTNSTLFVEINFYTRCARSTQISEWKKGSHLGVPEFIASGSFAYHGQRFRFLVLPRFGDDLEKLSSLCNGYFSTKTACNIGIQVIDCLEYIHSHGFVHKDIKGSNLLLHRKSKNKVFLADFGLASRYIHDGVHKPQAENPRMAHEGTLEYTSRDAHLGCFSRRGDMEVLFYNLIEWNGGCLPWDCMEEKRPNYYEDAKFTAFQQPLEFLNSCFGVDGYPEFLYPFMDHIRGLPFADAPDYNYLRKLLRKYSGPSRTLSFPKLPRKSIVTLKDSNQENVMPNFQCKAGVPLATSSPHKQPKEPLSSFRTENKSQYLRDREVKTQSLLQVSWDNPTPVMLEVIAAIKARQEKLKTSRRSFLRARFSKPSRSNSSTLHSKIISSSGNSCNTSHSAFKFDAKEALLLNRELSNLKCEYSSHSRIMTRTHSSTHTISMTSRSLRKQVRDALDMGLGNIATFLKSLYPFRIEQSS